MFKKAVRAVAASGIGLLLWKHRQASKASSHVPVADEVRRDQEIVRVAPTRPEPSKPTETALSSPVVVQPTAADLKENCVSPVKQLKEKLGKTFAGLVAPAAFGVSPGSARATMALPLPLIPIIPKYLNVPTKEVPARCSSSVVRQPVKDFPLIFSTVQEADARNSHDQRPTSELLADWSSIRRQVSPCATVNGNSAFKRGTIASDQNPTSTELDRMHEWLFSSSKEVQHSSYILTEYTETPSGLSVDQDALIKDCPSQEQHEPSKSNTEMPPLNRSTEIVLEADSLNKDPKDMLAKLTGGFAPEMRRRPRLALRLTSESRPTNTVLSDISNLIDGVSQARNGEQKDKQPRMGCKSPPAQCESPLRSRSRNIFRLPSPSFGQASTDESFESMHGLVFSASVESGEESLHLGSEVEESSVIEEKWYKQYRCSGDSSVGSVEQFELDVQALDAAEKELRQDGSPDLKHNSRYRTPRFESDEELYWPEKEHILRSCPGRIETAQWEHLIEVVEFEAPSPRYDHTENLQAEEGIPYLPWTCPGRTKISSEPMPIPEDEYAFDMLPTCPERISMMDYGEADERSLECSEWIEKSPSHNELTLEPRPQTLCSKREYYDNQEQEFQVLRPIRLEEEFESCRARAGAVSDIGASDVLKEDHLRSSTKVQATLRTEEVEYTVRTTEPPATTEANYGIESATVSGYEADEDDKLFSEENYAHDFPISALPTPPTEEVTAELSSSSNNLRAEEVTQVITSKTEECVFNSNRGGGICYFSEASDSDESILDAEQILEKFNSPSDKWDSYIDELESDAMMTFEGSTQGVAKRDHSGSEERITSAEEESESEVGEAKTSELSGNDDAMQNAVLRAKTSTTSPNSSLYNECTLLKGEVELSTEFQQLFDDDTNDWGTAVEEIEWEVDENADIGGGDDADCTEVELFFLESLLQEVEDSASRGDEDADCTEVEVISLENLFQEVEGSAGRCDDEADCTEVKVISLENLPQEGNELTDRVQDSVPDLKPTQEKLTSSLEPKGLQSDQQVQEDNREKEVELSLDFECDVRQSQMDQPPVEMRPMGQDLQFCEDASVRRHQSEAESPPVECQDPSESRILWPYLEKNNAKSEHAPRKSLPCLPSSPAPFVGLPDLMTTEVSISSLPDGTEPYKKREKSPPLMLIKKSADDSKTKRGQSSRELTEVVSNKKLASATEQGEFSEHIEDKYAGNDEEASKGSETLPNDERERPSRRRRRGKRGSRNGGKKNHQALPESVSSSETLSGVVSAVVEQIVTQTMGDIDGSEPFTDLESKKPRRRGRRGSRGVRRQKEQVAPEAEEKVGGRSSNIFVAGYLPHSSSDCPTSGSFADDSATDSCSEPEAEEKCFAKDIYYTTAPFLPPLSYMVAVSGSADPVEQEESPILGQNFTLGRSAAHLKVGPPGNTSMQSQAGKSEPALAGQGEEVLSQSQKRRLRRKRATERRAVEQRQKSGNSLPLSPGKEVDIQ